MAADENVLQRNSAKRRTRQNKHALTMLRGGQNDRTEENRAINPNVKNSHRECDGLGRTPCFAQTAHAIVTDTKNSASSA
jgi:hypothetical protein